MSPTADEMREETYKAYVARRRAFEAQESERRRQAGQVAIWLDRSPDDAETFTKDHQAELYELLGPLLRDKEFKVEALFMALDSADAVSGYTGQLIISLAQIASPVLTAALVAWLKGRPGRKVRVQFHPDGKLKNVEAQTPEQVVELMNAVRTEPDSQAPKKKMK